MTSVDGITWTARTSPVTNSWRSVTYGNGKIVAVAATGNGNAAMLISATAENDAFAEPEVNSQAVSAENEAILAAAKREAERQAARVDITSSFKNSKDVTVEMFVKAEIAGITTANIVAVRGEILALPETSRADLVSILKVARKFEVVGIVASDRVTSVYPNNLVEIGLISAGSKHKAALTEAIKNLPASERSSYAAIKEAIDAEMAEIQARKDRLTAILARIAAHRTR